jgi:hypothetical protein
MLSSVAAVACMFEGLEKAVERPQYVWGYR